VISEGALRIARAPSIVLGLLCLIYPITDIDRMNIARR
jgi:hypothetical protein